MEEVIETLEREILRRPEQYLWALAGGTSGAVEPRAVLKAAAGPIDKETGSASCPTRSQTASVSRTPSGAGRARQFGRRQLHCAHGVMPRTTRQAIVMIWAQERRGRADDRLCNSFVFIVFYSGPTHRGLNLVFSE